MKKDSKDLAGVCKDNDIQLKQSITEPTQQMGGEVWYQ
jgi:hypothetical protein